MCTLASAGCMAMLLALSGCQAQMGHDVAQASATKPDTPATIDVASKRSHPPQYPVQARREHHEGTVVLLVKVSANGHASRIYIYRSSGYPELDRAAVQAAKGWLFHPATRDGVRVAGVTRVPVTFSLGSTHRAPPQPCAGMMCIPVKRAPVVIH